jgi:hypothetical protein
MTAPSLVPVIDEADSISCSSCALWFPPRAKGRADLAKKERRFDVVISPTDFILADLSLRIL